MSLPSRKRQRRAGFTLVELMIALLAGSFAVIGVYYLSGVSSRSYQEQMRVSETQQALRSAMEQLRRDISRAGYLATPSTVLIPDCSGTRGVTTSADVAPRLVRALQVVHDGSVTSDNTVRTLLGNQTRGDILRMWGNYATADAYLTDPRNTTSTRIYFQINSESFRRSFCTPRIGDFPEECDYTKAFSDVFRVGRMLRVEQDGRFFFRDITAIGTTAPNPYVDINALPSCFEPTAWTAVAPVVRIRYQLEPDNNADSELSRLVLVPQDAERARSPALPGTRRTLLVRREELDASGAAVPTTSRMVLDYAIEFAVDAIVNTGAFDADPPTFALRTGANVGAESTNNPQNFRSLIVTLSSRTTDAIPDATSPFVPRPSRAASGRNNLLDSPLLNFYVYDPLPVPLYTRVRTMRSEIFLQNL